MKEEFFRAKLRVIEPEGGLPGEFWVITACNPEGEPLGDFENGKRTADFRKELVERRLAHFPVAGYDPRPGVEHEEPGYGVACDGVTAMELGRKWGQLAVFGVREGKVELVSCVDDERYDAGSWEEMTSG